MSSLTKYTSNIVSSISAGHNLPLPPVTTSLRSFIEIPRSIIPTSSPIQLLGSEIQEIPSIMSNNKIIAMLTKMERHIAKQCETNKMIFDRAEELGSSLRRSEESTPTPFSFFQTRMLNFEIGASSESQVEDFISKQAPVFIDGSTHCTGGPFCKISKGYSTSHLIPKILG